MQGLGTDPTCICTHIHCTCHNDVRMCLYLHNGIYLESKIEVHCTCTYMYRVTVLIGVARRLLRGCKLQGMKAELIFIQGN